PAVIPAGPLSAVMPARYSVTTPAGVIFATLPPSNSVNQRLPSGPAAISLGLLPAVMPVRDSVIVGAAALAADASSAIPSDTTTSQRRPDPTPLSSLLPNRTRHSAGRACVRPSHLRTA